MGVRAPCACVTACVCGLGVCGLGVCGLGVCGLGVCVRVQGRVAWPLADSADAARQVGPVRAVPCVEMSQVCTPQRVLCGDLASRVGSIWPGQVGGSWRCV